MFALADAAAKRWADLRLRVVSAAVLAPLALTALWVGGWAWRVLVFLALMLMAREWAGFWRGQRRLLLPAGLLYLALAAAAIMWLRDDAAAGRGNMLFVLLVVWASDIGAYLAGRLIGGRRLAPRISPGKTWSGAVGGLFAAALVGAVTGGVRGAAVAAVLGIAAQAGDLIESAAKRGAGVKDSGALIPGHGGVLDRLDGVLAAGPAAALLALALGRGGVLWQ